jgi:hypothetical protein
MRPIEKLLYYEGRSDFRTACPMGRRPITVARPRRIFTGFLDRNGERAERYGLEQILSRTLYSIGLEERHLCP